MGRYRSCVAFVKNGNVARQFLFKNVYTFKLEHVFSRGYSIEKANFDEN